MKVLLTLLVAWLVWLLVVPLLALIGTQRVDATPSGPRPPEHPGTAVLLVGTDRRDNLTTAQQKRLGTGTESGVRTDTMLILYTPPSGRSVLISLPRDSYLPIPGHGRNKLNAAYAIGGAPLLVESVEEATGLRMNGYMEIGFDGFVNLVDAVGGVTVDLAKPMKDRDAHIDLPAGRQRLDGVQALGYVRMRKSDPLGDLGRIKRQQQVASQVARKILSPWTLVNPVRYWKVTHAAASSVRRGTDTSLPTTVRTGLGLMKASGSDGVRLTVPVADVNATTAAGSSVLWDTDRAAELFAQLNRGSTEGIEKFAH